MLGSVDLEVCCKVKPPPVGWRLVALPGETAAMTDATTPADRLPGETFLQQPTKCWEQ
jgi:hypothetical protein